jgi:hypothetical protein
MFFFMDYHDNNFLNKKSLNLLKYVSFKKIKILDENNVNLYDYENYEKLVIYNHKKVYKWLIKNKYYFLNKYELIRHALGSCNFYFLKLFKNMIITYDLVKFGSIEHKCVLEWLLKNKIFFNKYNFAFYCRDLMDVYVDEVIIWGLNHYSKIFIKIGYKNIHKKIIKQLQFKTKNKYIKGYNKN